MKWIRVRAFNRTPLLVYETIWFRYHPMIGPVAFGDPMPTIYPTWREAWDLAWSLVR